MFGLKPQILPQHFAFIMVPEFTMMPVTSAIASWIAAASGEYDQTLPQLAQRTRRPSPPSASSATR